MGKPITLLAASAALAASAGLAGAQENGALNITCPPDIQKLYTQIWTQMLR